MGVKQITNKEILSTISKEWEDNKCVVFNTNDGVVAAPVYTVLEQNYQDILLSLGRGFTEIYCLASQADNDLNGVYTGANKTRFINDLAASYIIMSLKNNLDKSKADISKLENRIKDLECQLSWEQYKK